MSDTPSPTGFSWARLRPILVEAITRARRVGIGFAILVAFIGTALSWYVGEPLIGYVLTILATLSAFFLVCMFEFFRVAREKDRAVIPLVLRVAGEAALICLCVRLGWLGWRDHREMIRLSRATATANEQRIEIANDAVRLTQLLQGQERFDDAVCSAEGWWKELTARAQRDLTSPQPLTGPTGWAKAVDTWQAIPLGAVQNAARSVLDDQIGEIRGQTDHFNPATPVSGEENMSNAFNRAQWRGVNDMHQRAEEFIATASSKMKSEIEPLIPKVLVAAGCNAGGTRAPSFNLCPR
jgi:hypothetical protein